MSNRPIPQGIRRAKGRDFERSGFNREFENPSNPASIDQEQEGVAFIVVERHPFAGRGHQDGRGVQAGQQGYCDADVDQKNPSLVLNASVEPEALAMVASNYQRAD
jgi:hypothetical protein